MIIAIDGPAGSGKSTVSKMVAEKLGILYVDTGAMYRAITLKAVNMHLDLKDADRLIEITKNSDIKLLHDKDKGFSVLLDGKDVSKEIRTPELTNKVKFIAGVPGVREEMVKIQRKIARSGQGAVLEGRDIGTIVFPDADKKIYLNADFKERVKRRHKELVEGGQKIDYAAIKADVDSRDRNDMERKVAPLKKADDAIEIDTTKLTIEETVEKILSCIK